MARGLQLLKPDGTMSYIVSDTWRTIKSHKPLRKRILDKTTVFHFLDLPAWIFDATVNTGIITFRKAQSPDEHKLIAGDLRGIENGDWQTLSDNLIAVSGHGPDIQTINCARYTYPQILIATNSNLPFFVASPKFFYVLNSTNSSLGDIGTPVQGIGTGDNRFYLRKENHSRGGYEIIDNDKILTLDDIDSFSEDEKLNGVDPSDYNGRHFILYDKGGSSDIESGWLPQYNVKTGYYIDWSRNSVHRLFNASIEDCKKRRIEEDGKRETIRVQDKDIRAAWLPEPENWFKKGITFSRTGQYAPTFRLKCPGPFDNKSDAILTNSPFFILGIANSMISRYFMKNFLCHTVQSEKHDIEKLPAPNFDDLARSQIERFVEQIIQQQRQNPRYDYARNEQVEIDFLVSEAHGLDKEDVREIELWYCRRYARLAEAQGVMAEVKEKYADHLARCERILERPPSYWRSNPILQLIAQGESHTLEFKETLEYNTHTNERTPGLVKSSLKTIVAFLNADGGSLLIGVSDSGEVKGIARDLQFVRGNNTDGFEQKLRSLLNDHFDPSPRGNVDIKFEDLQDGTVCQIKVEPSSEPVAYDNDFYIRDGNGTRKLEGRDLADWLRRRNHS